MRERADGWFRCNCPQCQARYDLCPAARELEEIITNLTSERNEALAKCEALHKAFAVVNQTAHEEWTQRTKAEAERDRLRLLLHDIIAYCEGAQVDWGASGLQARIEAERRWRDAMPETSYYGHCPRCGVSSRYLTTGGCSRCGWPHASVATGTTSACVRHPYAGVISLCAECAREMFGSNALEERDA